MLSGSVEAIYLHSGTTGGAPMVAVDQTQAHRGAGLEGDRFWQGAGSTATKMGPDREVTLIEAETIEAVLLEGKVTITPATTRRNIITRGVALNHLVHREFRVGSTVLRGLRLCEPCRHLEAMTQPGMLMALLHRGGLRAQVVETGAIRVGDSIEPLVLAAAGPVPHAAR